MAGSSKEWAESARKVEDLGYSSLTMPDHFNEQLAPVPALMAVAAATSTLRIGTLVFDNDYKHPLVLAKECATLDLLSDGRLELGLGAGWMRTDYEQSGIRYDPPKVRVDRFEEALHVLKGLFADGAFSHAGEHYTITEHDGQPKPLQRPHPPQAGRRRDAHLGCQRDIGHAAIGLQQGEDLPVDPVELWPAHGNPSVRFRLATPNSSGE